MTTQRCLLLFPVIAVLSFSAAMVATGSRTDTPSLATSTILPADEELVYEVSWTAFKLGTIRVLARRDLTAEAHIDSYTDLPFVDLHSVHYSTMDTSFYSRASRSLEQKSNEWWGLTYRTDHENRCLRVDETYQTDLASPPHTTEPKDSIRLEVNEFVDGLSIAFFPRRFIHRNVSVVVPTVLYGKMGKTTFHFSQKKTTETLEVLDRPVRMVEIEGTTSVVGIFGMTGDFRGWFSDDEAAVPLKGRLRVLLGSVDVELIRWKRTGWNPPIAERTNSGF